MDSLDSRHLHYTDCFFQRFAAPGLVRYAVSRGFAVTAPESAGEDAYTIEVAEAGAEKTGAQHRVVVRKTGNRLEADPPTLHIQAGDVVLWNAADASVPAFAIHGAADGTSFDSAALAHECVFSHPFGLPGRYRWVDAHGSGVGGEVVVRPHETQPREIAKMHEHLQVGTAISVRGKEVTPREVEVMAGQTVFWIVERAPGITITDRRLLHHRAPSEGRTPAG